MLAREWQQTPYPQIRDQVIGIVGMGNIGKHLATLLQPLQPKALLYTSRQSKPEIESHTSAKFESFTDLMAISYSVMIHVSYNEDTHEMFDCQIFSRMMPGSRLYCFANPRVIRAKALRQALLSGPLSFAYMDGYYTNGWTAQGLMIPEVY